MVGSPIWLAVKVSDAGPPPLEGIPSEIKKHEPPCLSRGHESASDRSQTSIRTPNVSLVPALFEHKELHGHLPESAFPTPSARFPPPW